MKTLKQFKIDNNITSPMEFIQSPGKRAIAVVGTNTLVVSKEAKITEPLYVSPLTNEAGVLQPNTYVLFNSLTAVPVFEL